MNDAAACQKCSVIEKTMKRPRGSGIFEMFLWLISIVPAFLAFVEPLPIYFFWMGFIVPALGYSIWRRRSGYIACGKCKIPLTPNWHPTNRPAVAGLLFGLMLHIPLISGIIALVLAGFGKKRAKSIEGQGAFVAKFAMILGIVNIVGWMAVSMAISMAMSAQNERRIEEVPHGSHDQGSPLSVDLKKLKASPNSVYADITILANRKCEAQIEKEATFATSVDGKKFTVKYIYLFSQKMNSVAVSGDCRLLNDPEFGTVIEFVSSPATLHITFEAGTSINPVVLCEPTTNKLKSFTILGHESSQSRLPTSVTHLWSVLHNK